MRPCLLGLVTGRKLVSQTRGDNTVFETFVRPGSYGVFGVIK
jgi:hypothetical protein